MHGIGCCGLKSGGEDQRITTSAAVWRIRVHLHGHATGITQLSLTHGECRARKWLECDRLADRIGRTWRQRAGRLARTIARNLDLARGGVDCQIRRGRRTGWAAPEVEHVDILDRAATM